MKKVVLIISFLVGALNSALAYEQEGMASWYGGKFQGRQTANGEIFDTNDLTAAHNELPFNTLVLVTNLENGKQVQVRINDRGPYAKGRILDLSRAAAAALDMEHQGIAHIKINADASVAEAINYCYIQVGAYRNIKNAARLKQMLADAGLSPYAVMTSEGIVRIEIRNVHKQEAQEVVFKLKSLGVQSPLVKM